MDFCVNYSNWCRFIRSTLSSRWNFFKKQNHDFICWDVVNNLIDLFDDLVDFSILFWVKFGILAGIYILDGFDNLDGIHTFDGIHVSDGIHSKYMLRTEYMFSTEFMLSTDFKHFFGIHFFDKMHFWTFPCYFGQIPCSFGRILCSSSQNAYMERKVYLFWSESMQMNLQKFSRNPCCIVQSPVINSQNDICIR